MWALSEIVQFFNMLLKIWWLVKWQVTYVTLERLLLGVCPFVLLEMRRVSETFFTNWALMGLWLCMDSFMQFKTPCCSKSLVALFTFKGLQIIMMLHVTVKIWLLMKALFTLWTPVWFYIAVVFNMSLKISWLVKIFPTLGTGKALLIMSNHVLKDLLIWKEQNCWQLKVTNFQNSSSLRPTLGKVTKNVNFATVSHICFTLVAKPLRSLLEKIKAALLTGYIYIKNLIMTEIQFISDFDLCHHCLFYDICPHVKLVLLPWTPHLPPLNP